MITGVCPSCGRRLVLVVVGTPCRCPEQCPAGSCPVSRPRRVVREHGCGRHLAPKTLTEAHL